MKQRKRQTKNPNPQKRNKQRSYPINHATIIEGLDTEVLQEDIPHEYNVTFPNYGSLVGGEWVRFFNHRSSVLKNMYTLVQNSTTLARAISDRVNLIMGDGFNALDTGGQIPFLKSLRNMFKYALGKDTAEQKMNEIISKVNNNNESLSDVIRKVAYDYEAFGNAFIYIKKITVGNEVTHCIYHSPIDQTAVHKVDENGLIPSIGIYDNWDYPKAEEIKVIPMFPNFAKTDNYEVTAIHIKNYAPNFFYYGLPSWYSARFWAEIEYYIPKYNISKFLNGFLPSVFIELFGNLDEDEANEMTRAVVDAFTGVGNGSKIFTQCTSSPEYAAKVHTITDNSEGKFLDLQKMATQNIVTGAQSTMSLSGVAQGGKLGTNQQVSQELNLIMNTSVKHVRQTILTKIVNPFIELQREYHPEIAGLMLTIANSQPISIAGDIDPNQVLTRNEMRDILGYAPDDLQETTQGQQNQNQ